MALETSIHDLVQQLRRAGPRPSERLIERILAYGPSARGGLLTLATEKQTLHEPEPVCWGPVHALRLLMEMPDVTMIPPLLATIPVEVQAEGDAGEYWASEVLDVIASCGPESIPLLWAYGDDTNYTERARGAAVHALVFVVYGAPEAREIVTTEARTRLTTCTDPLMGAFLVNVLAQLGVAAAYAEVMAGYHAGRVNAEIIPAATARQLLLAAKPAVPPRYTFWERYEFYGPFAED